MPPTLEEVEDTGEFTDPNVKLMINAGIPPSWYVSNISRALV